MSGDPKKRNIVSITGIIWPFILALLSFIFLRIAENHPALTEHYYSKGIYPVIACILSYFSYLIPFSLWDVFWMVFILLIIAGIILIIVRKLTFKWYILKTMQVAAILYSLFYISWGYNYFRPGIEKRLNWTVPVKDEVLFRTVLDSVINETNLNYISFSKTDIDAIDSLVEKSYSANSQLLGISYPGGRRRPKTMIVSSFFAKTGISGYFGPFFNEVHINRYLLAMDYPFTLAHEKAHQFGMTNEAEANLAAFIVCTTSNDQRIRYSAYQALLVYFLKDASKLENHKLIIKKINKSVIDDLKRKNSYYEGLQNQKLSDMQTTANDIYLKANKITTGIRNYNQVVSLVISWYSNKVKS